MSAYCSTILLLTFQGTGQRKRINMAEETSRRRRDDESGVVGRPDATRLAGRNSRHWLPSSWLGRIWNLPLKRTQGLMRVPTEGRLLVGHWASPATRFLLTSYRPVALLFIRHMVLGRGHTGSGQAATTPLEEDILA